MQNAIIKTAAPLSEKEQELIQQRFERLLGGKLSFQFQVQSDLIGGFAAYIDGKLYDISMLTQLSLIKKQLEELSTQAEGETPEQFAESLMRKMKESLSDLSLDGGERVDFKHYAATVGEHMRRKVSALSLDAKVFSYGVVQSCADGIVRIEGLGHSRYGELLEFENNAFGMALELSEKGVGAVLFAGAAEVYAGSIVRGTGRVLDIGVGTELLGRVIDPLGRPLDGKPLDLSQFRPLESPAPGIMDRAPVTQPLQTGILSIDSMIPIGKGQRELIIGDRQMGKSIIALSAIVNQARQGVICVYCAIGQKASAVTSLVRTLEERGVMDKCVVVAATASDSAAMQYINPYAGCAIAEYFMYAGKDVLIIYDDLSKHATSYRTMSLLLKRPPGREAYPGDVFYLHSRLLERAAKLSPEKGGGSMTALPIVETMGGDISAYIPTNVISITDGQIYLESDLFHAGVRPAINVGLSVSRVGRAAQPDAIRQVSGQLRLHLAQYREMAVFAQFGADIDASTKRLLDSGERLTELLKQDQNTVYPLWQQVAILVAYEKGAFNAMPISRIGAYKKALLAYLERSEHSLIRAIDAGLAFPREQKALLEQAVGRFVKSQPAD